MNVISRQVASNRVIRYASAEVKSWAGAKFGVTFRDPSFALGILDGRGKLTGAVIYNNFEARNVEMSIYGPRGAFYKNVSREIFAYAFEELDCLRVTLTCREFNWQVIKQARKWGWEIEGRYRNYYGEGDHAILLGMLREECRFLTSGRAPASHQGDRRPAHEPNAAGNGTAETYAPRSSRSSEPEDRGDRQH